MPETAQAPAALNIQLVVKPNHKQLATLWESRISIPEEVKYAFADVSPTFDEFQSAVEKGNILCVLTQSESGELLTAAWLHDLERDHEGLVRVGWLGGYVFPKYRGRHCLVAAHMVFDHFADIGIQHLHTAIHIENRPIAILYAK